MKVEDFLVSENATLVEALMRLDQTGKKCIFVVEGEGRLVGSLTDGDVRRRILANGSLEGTAGQVANRSPVTAVRGDTLPTDLGVTAVPILDVEGHVTDIVFSDGEVGKCRRPLPEPMPVVMMAGGVGSRLLPLTAILPKPLIPVNGTTIAERIIERFRGSGCNDFYLVLNYKKGMIKAYFDDIERDYNVTYVEEEEFLGTGGGLKLVEPYLNSTFILTNCDILVDASVNDLLEVHRRAKNAVTCVCSLKSFVVPYGTIEISEGGQIEDMCEKPATSVLINTGCYMVEPKVLDYIGENENIGFPDVMTRCQKSGLKVGVFPISEGAWLDMGQFDEMRRMNDMLVGEREAF